jgi:hypothetical protein
MERYPTQSATSLLSSKVQRSISKLHCMPAASDNRGGKYAGSNVLPAKQLSNGSGDLLRMGITVTTVTEQRYALRYTQQQTP